MDKFHDECGVVGVFLPKGEENAATLAYYALCALQHRGQESAGICVSTRAETDSDRSDFGIPLKKGMGLVSEVFTKSDLEALRAPSALAHVRYATKGSRTIENAQPMLMKTPLGAVAVAHNGQLVNYEPLQEMLEDSGSTFLSTSDTEIILKMIARGYKKGLEGAVKDALKVLKGSYALAVLSRDVLIASRDPYGIRPLSLGKIGEGYIVASESCAIDAVGGEFLRDIRPGELIIISEVEGKCAVKSISLDDRSTATQTCIFEYVYFARPDSVIDGISVEEARLNMGITLAREYPLQADIVMGVPDSGLGAAIGYSKESGTPFSMGIVKNKYIGRTFIAPTQAERENMVFVKLNAIKSELFAKRIIVIDDSIVRGTTSRRLVQLLRRAGAKEVHFLVSSPPVKFPCYLGIDTPTKAELIGSFHEIEEIRKEIGSDTLNFISLEGMIASLRRCIKGTEHSRQAFCKGCFSGVYPVA